MEPTRQYMPYSGYPYGVPSTTRHFPPVPGPTVYRSGQGTPVPVTGIPVTTPVILSVTPVIPLPVAQVPHTPVVTTYTQPSTPAQFIPLSAPQIQNQTGRSWHYAPMRYNQNS
jgi:hypothetical protein